MGLMMTERVERKRGTDPFYNLFRHKNHLLRSIWIAYSILESSSRVSLVNLELIREPDGVVFLSLLYRS